MPYGAGLSNKYSGSNTDRAYKLSPQSVRQFVTKLPVSAIEKHTMKLYTTVLLLASALVSAAPTLTFEEGTAKVLAKRASVTDAANIGYATQNGG